MADKRAGEVSGTAAERTATLKHDIERTRNEIEDTVLALETRLSPSRLKEQISTVKEHAVEQFRDAKEQMKTELKRDVNEAKQMVKGEIGEARAAVREATVGKVEHMVHRASNQFRETRTSLVDNVRENPVPFALIGLGVGWLLMGRSRGQRFNRYERSFGYGGDGGRNLGPRIAHAADGAKRVAADFVHDAREKASDVVGGVGDSVSEAFGAAKDRVGHVYEEGRDAASRTIHDGRDRALAFERKAEHIVEDNPLAVGAIAFAVGAAVGLAIPASKAEDKLFGEAKQKLVQRATDAAREAVHMAEERATSALHGGSAGALDGQKGDSDQRGPESRSNGLI